MNIQRGYSAYPQLIEYAGENSIAAHGVMMYVSMIFSAAHS